MIDIFDYAFPENGLVAYEQGKLLECQVCVFIALCKISLFKSFIKWLGEEKYKKFANFCLRYMSEIDILEERSLSSAMDW